MPGGRLENLKVPFSEVKALCMPIKDGLVASTLTPGRGVPCSSVTTPAIFPVIICPREKLAAIVNKKNNIIRIFIVSFLLFIISPL